MGVQLVKKPVQEKIQVRAENGKWSRGLNLPEAFHRIDAFLDEATTDKGRLGTQKDGDKAKWGKPVLIPTLSDRIHVKLPNSPLGLLFLIDRKAGSSEGPDLFLARQSMDPGHLPPLRSWQSFNGNAKAVCSYAKHDKHFTTIPVNGHPAKGQPQAVYSFRDVAYELQTKYGITIWSVSGQRSCDYQCTVCKNICGNCGGCPGRCGAPGGSTHQPGLAQDFFIKSHPKRTYAQAYQLCKKVFMSHGWDNFTGWSPSGTDPNHASYKCRA